MRSAKRGDKPTAIERLHSSVVHFLTHHHLNHTLTPHLNVCVIKRILIKMAEKHEKQKSVSKKRKLAQMLRLFKRGHKSSHSEVSHGRTSASTRREGKTEEKKSDEDRKDERGSDEDVGGEHYEKTSGPPPPQPQPPPPPPPPQTRTMRKRVIQRKYGKVEDVTEETKEEAEEFENVAAKVRPAQAKMRATDLKWKTLLDDAEGEEGTVEQGDDAPGDQQKPASASSSDSKTRTAESVTAIRKKTERSVSDIPVLLKRIDELEGALKNAVRIRKRYRRKIRDQQQTIEELNAALKNPQNVVYDEDERPSEWEEAVAKRALEIIRREKLLEQPVKYKELKELNKYFESSEAKLEPMVMRIMDKALTFAVDELLSRQQNAKGGTVDNEMRLFLVDKNKAKRILLTVMTTRPEYLPESWGGDAARRRPVKIPEKKRSARHMNRQRSYEAERTRDSRATSRQDSFSLSSCYL
ncbi:hypothetical protein Q1695_004826 [Nippostrongylus brasiliensis]|nr:hypothetical protein Q1695_004826 [Nippostrongylus brasiliensis]